MALVKFLSGDGVEHEVEEGSMAADVMRQNGFMVISIDGERQPISAIEPEATVYSEEDAIAQNDGEDVSAKAPAKKAPVKKKANA